MENLPSKNNQHVGIMSGYNTFIGFLAIANIIYKKYLIHLTGGSTVYNIYTSGFLGGINVSVSPHAVKILTTQVT